MKIRALELDQFRKFDRPIRLTGFSDQMNLICGPNEFGKSTLLAAIRAVLFERHNSRAEPIKRMQTWRSNTAPRLAMEFDVGEGTWRVEKRFVNRPMALLSAPDGRRFEDDAAEEELQRLLGFGASGNKGARAEQMGVWGALWVTQRDSLVQADLSSDMARSTITSCLDAEVGVLTGGEKGQALIRAVREQLAKLLDGRGNPKDRYKLTVTELAEADSKLAELRAREDRLGKDAEELRRTKGLLDHQGNPAHEADDRLKVEEARRARETALLYAQRLEAATSALALASKESQDAAAELVRRQTVLDAIEAGERTVSASAALADKTEKVALAAESDASKKRSAIGTAESRQQICRAKLEQVKIVEEMLRQTGTLALLEQILGRAQTAQDLLNNLVARQQAMRIDPDRIAAFRAAWLAREQAASVLEARATRIDFDILPQAVGQVTIDGISWSPLSRSISAVEPTAIDLAGIGRITVRPAIQDREKLLKNLRASEAKLQAALLPTGCARVEDVEPLWSDYEALGREVATARAELARLAPGDEATELKPGPGALVERVAVLRLRIERERLAAGLDSLPPQEAVEAERRDLEAEDLEAAKHLGQAVTALTAAVAFAASAREDAAIERERRKTATEQLARLKLEADLAEAGDAAASVRERLAMARANRQKLGEDLAAHEAGCPVDTAELLQTRIERLEQTIDLRRQTVRKLQLAMAELRSRITQEGGYGLDELIQSTERTRDALMLELASQQREVRILDLLLKTLLVAERETKDRYLVPVTKRVTPYLRSLFPGADIICDDALRITNVTRGRSGAEDFDRLSDGTQEQIAVLARLAFAEMLVDQKRPAMVILDDALAYSDPERLDRMFDILVQASRKIQVLILTCREDLFARLGGNRVEIERVGTAEV